MSSPGLRQTIKQTERHMEKKERKQKILLLLQRRDTLNLQFKMKSTVTTTTINK